MGVRISVCTPLDLLKTNTLYIYCIIMKYSYAAFRLACCAAHCIAALMMIFVQLRKRHLPQRDDQEASSVLPISQYPCCFPHCGQIAYS